MTSRFLKPRDAGTYLGISERKVRYLEKEGKLPSYNFDGCRRFKVSDLEAYAEARLEQ